MMEVNNKKELCRAVCKISCGTEHGTAFLITKKHVITASHCIIPYQDGKEIKLEFRNLSTKPIICGAYPINDYSSHGLPVIILELQQELDYPIKFPVFHSLVAKEDMIVTFFGYPEVESNDGLWTKGSIGRAIDSDQVQIGDWNLQLIPIETRIKNFCGHSGSPLFYNGSFIGLLGAQTCEDGQAITISAISVDRFIDYLTANNISIITDGLHKKDEDISNTGDAIVVLSRKITHQQNTIQELISNNESLLDKKYNEIINTAFSQSKAIAYQELESTLTGLTASSGNSVSMAKLYYLAALWSLPHDQSKASSYYNTACSIYSDIDTRLYRSSLFEIAGDYHNAEKVLHPIDSTTLLNQYLMILFNNEKVHDIEPLLNQYNSIQFNEGTIHASFLFNLRASNYDKALEDALKLTSMRETSGLFTHFAGIALYRKAVARSIHYNQENIFDIMIPHAQRLNRQETADSEKSLDYFQKAYELADAYMEHEVICNSLLGILANSWMLKRITEAKRISLKLLEIDKGNPIALFFLVDHNFLSDINITDMEQRSHDDVNVAIAYIKYLTKQNEYDKAAVAFEALGERIISRSTFDFVELKIDFLINKRDFQSAYSILEQYKNQLQPNEYDRSLLYILQYDSSKKPNEIIGKAVYIKEQSGDYIDYYNLCCIYRRFGRWKRLARVARDWKRKHMAYSANDFIAESQLNMGKASECLVTLSEIESDFDLTNSQKIIKLNCLTSLSKFDDALALIDDFGGLSYADEALIIHKAKLELSKGDFQESIRTLRMFIRANDDNIEASLFLSNLLKTDNPKEAFDVLFSLHKKYPERKDIALEAMAQGFMSGNDNEAGKIMQMIYQEDSDEKYMKGIKTTDLLSYITANKKENEQLFQHYLDGLLPMHIFFDMKNILMGHHAYSKWVLMDDNFSPLSFGGRPEYNLSDEFQNKQVILDYSACLTIECLNLFPHIEKAFDKIFVSPSLIPCIHYEIGRISSIQESVKQRNEKLYKFFQNRGDNISIVDDCIEPNDSIDAEAQDIILYNTGKAHGAYIVKDNFACQLFYEKEAPENLKDIQIYESELLEALARIGVIPNQSHTIEPRNEKVTEIIESKKPLIVDSNTLDELSQYADLSDIASRLPFMILKSDVDQLAIDNQAIINQGDCGKWLKALKSKLVGLNNKGILEFCPQAPHKDKSGNLAAIVIDCMAYSQETGIPVWIDDRFSNSYSNSGSGVIFGIFDFLNTLAQTDIITQFEYNKLYGELIRNNISYHVPTKRYVLNVLKIADVDEDGYLKESNALLELRRYISWSLSANSLIGKESRKNNHFPEIYGYILLLNRVFCDMIIAIWSDEEEDTLWKAATSEWLWFNMSDFVCDVSLPQNQGIEHNVSSKHMFLLTTMFRVKPKFQNDCRDWVFTVLYSYWIIHPEDKKRLSHIMAEFICGESFDSETSDEKQKYELLVLGLCQKLFPTDFYGMILEDPLCFAKWGDRYENIQIEMEQVDFPLASDYDDIKYDSECNFVEEMHSTPENWRDIVLAVINYNEGAETTAVLNFFNSYIDKHGVKDIPKECRKALEYFMMAAPLEHRVELRELMRRF